MHQQPNDRSCANEAIGGDHYCPVQVYMAKVDDATSAVGSDAAWFTESMETESRAIGLNEEDMAYAIMIIYFVCVSLPFLFSPHAAS